MSSYIITKDHLQLQRKDDLQFKAILMESRAYRALNSSGSAVTVFLSHKHDELDILENAISLIKRCGVDVYVDWNVNVPDSSHMPHWNALEGTPDAFGK